MSKPEARFRIISGEWFLPINDAAKELAHKASYDLLLFWRPIDFTVCQLRPVHQRGIHY